MIVLKNFHACTVYLPITGAQYFRLKRRQKFKHIYFSSIFNVVFVFIKVE
jgi:hypothetical protein